MASRKNITLCGSSDIVAEFFGKYLIKKFILW